MDDDEPGPFFNWMLKGRVRNKSQYRLMAFTLKIFAEQCPGETPETCDTVAEATAQSQLTIVPAGQLRSFAIDFNFDAPAGDNPKWRYQVIDLVADK